MSMRSLRTLIYRLFLYFHKFLDSFFPSRGLPTYVKHHAASCPHVYDMLSPTEKKLLKGQLETLSLVPDTVREQ
jgi:hypothetical protein